MKNNSNKIYQSRLNFELAKNFFRKQQVDASIQAYQKISIDDLENNEIASQIAETERKQDILVKILKETTSTCPKCKMEVAKRLSQITGVIESVSVEEADVV